MKSKHESAKFRIVTCNLLTFSHLRPVADLEGDLWEQRYQGELLNQGEQRPQGRASLRKARCAGFRFVL